MSRNNFFEASRTNFTETGLTGWYGMVGASLSVGVPLVGNMSPALASLCLVMPILSRWNQTSEISSENDGVNDNRYHYYARTGVKAIVNLAIFAATHSIGLQFGQTACFLFLVSFTVSKFINLGDASPIEHIEDFFSNRVKAYPENRLGLFSSLGANVTDTMRATFYGLVAIATQFPLPLIGQLTVAAAGLLFVVPLSARISQINTIGTAITPQQARYHRAKALVSTMMDILVGLGLFATATLLQLDKIAILFVLGGWISAKLTSGGEKSPIDHTHRFFNWATGASEIPVANNVVRIGEHNATDGQSNVLLNQRAG